MEVALIVLRLALLGVALLVVAWVTMALDPAKHLLEFSSLPHTYPSTTCRCCVAGVETVLREARAAQVIKLSLVKVHAPSFPPLPPLLAHPLQGLSKLPCVTPTC